MKARNLYLLFIFVFTAFQCFSQKVGLVLSGGGASGLAHIGVLKALEENNIPIDYICGTSSGAMVGSLYAIGYTPAQIEKLVKSETFRNLALGKIENKYNYYFKKDDDNASWIQFKVSFNSGIETSLPTNIINSAPVDFGLMEIYAKSAAAAKYNFDSLMIPFRCVASDIDANESVVFKNGDLGEAIRASISYPFYLKPIIVNGKLLFDGGLYNNFPSDVMYNDFFPDYIIGSTVTGNVAPATDDNIVSQIRSMMMTTTNFGLMCETGTLIEPKTNIGPFDFNNPQQLIDSGYVSTMRKIHEIKQAISRRSDNTELNKKRTNFLNGQHEIFFDKISVEGVNKKQSHYIQKSIQHKNEPLGLPEMKKQYFKLVNDDKIKSLFPKASFNNQNGFYDLQLKVKKEKELVAFFGGNLSNRPISEGFVGLQYNYLGKTAVSIYGNTYFGRLYSSAQLKARIDIPTRIPFYLQPIITYNRWDYYKSSELFFADVKPTYLIQGDQYAGLDIGTPAVYNGKILAGAAYATIKNEYYQTDKFTQQDTADVDELNLFTSYIMYEKNTFNRKLYPSEGHYFLLKARYCTGEEFNQPGSTGIDKYTSFRQNKEWIQLKAVYDNYFIYRGRIKLGIRMEGVYSNQVLSANYASTILLAPAFQPTPETRTLFLENYRANNYLAGGLKNIISFRKNLELRLEGYIFLPQESILKGSDLKAYYGKSFDTKHYIATVAGVYTTPVGPISISMNYYDREKAPLTFLFHFGYTIFNKRALE
ncbi:MAG: patatin-like phospholipase family protein [Bacteroidia bacterium]|nr:patatin-like phospholipase family protein [Bacteroidia bacterium]